MSAGTAEEQLTLSEVPATAAPLIHTLGAPSRAALPQAADAPAGAGAMRFHIRTLCVPSRVAPPQVADAPVRAEATWQRSAYITGDGALTTHAERAIKNGTAAGDRLARCGF